MFLSRLLFIAVTGLLHLGLFYVTQDLSQWNRETLFLPDQEKSKYLNFKDKINERSILAARWKSAEKTGQGWLDEIRSIDDGIDIYSQKDFLSGLEKAPEAIRSRLQEAVLNTLPFRVKEKTQSLFVTFPTDLKPSLRNQVLDILNSGPQSLEIVGLPYTNRKLDHYSESIKFEVFPLLFVISGVLTFLVTGSIVTTMILFFPCLFGLSHTLFFTQSVFKDLNMITSIAPLLVFVLNLALGFHIFFTYLQEGSRQKVWLNKRWPILLTLVTTLIGFGSLMISEIEAIRQFALVAFSTLMSSYAHSLLWYYFLLPWVPKKFTNSLQSIFPSWLIGYKPPAWLAITLCLIGVILGLSFKDQIPVETNAVNYFPQTSGLRQKIQRLETEFVGNPNFEILIQEKSNIEVLKSFEDHLDEHFKTRNYHWVSSFKFHQLDQQLRSLGFSLPAFNQLSQHYTLESARWTLLGPSVGSAEYFSQLDEIKEKLNDLEIRRFQINGLYFNLMSSQRALLGILAQSFGLSLLIISLISFLAFRQLRIFFIYLIVNISPVGLTLYAMYFCGLSLNIATVMTFSISLGIIVDSSLHLTHHFLNGDDFDHIYKTTKLPILVSSLILIVGFALFAQNGFLPIQEFGLNLSIALSFGLMFDLYVLPSLLSAQRHQ